MVESRDTLSVLVIVQYLVLGTLLAGTTLVAARRRGARYALALLGLDLALIGGIALVFPIYGAYYASVPSALLFVAAAVALLSVVAGVALLLSPASIDRLFGMLHDRPWLQNYGLMILSVTICVGGLEAAAQLVTRLGLVAYYVPVETRLGRQTEDWRLAHVMDDDLREPDPVLFWRPVPRYPYSSQGFKGPLIDVPKPPTIFRIMCYGDSNTDGPGLSRAWPARLQANLDHSRSKAGRHYEVVNAGVVGYSSYQGLMRLRGELDRYTPDMVLVSFGWNDATQAIGPPDKDFAGSGLLPHLAPWAVFLRRVLLRYRLDLIVLHYLHPVTTDIPGATSYMPRVSPGDFAANLRGFVVTTRQRGAVPVLLTRPHRPPSAVLAPGQTWRRQVPSYNAEVLRVAAELDVLAVDVDRFSEGKPELFSDECHFTAQGHEEMAQLLAAELEAHGYLN